MPENRLNVITVNSDISDSSFQNMRKTRSKELQAKFERLWLIDPERFNPLRNCLERERLDRTWNLLVKHIEIANQKVVDIGCGSGVFSRRMRDAKANVGAIDIAENALKKFKEIDAQDIHIQQDIMPNTHLADHGYQVVVCTELIAEIPKEDYRLFFAELSRIIQPSGLLVCSSPIDIYSEGGMEKLNELAQSEFDIIEEKLSYHALYIRLKHFIKSPLRFIKGWNNKDFRKNEMNALNGFARWSFWLNTTPFMIWFWYLCRPLVSPICKFMNDSTKTLRFLEKICRFLWDKDGVSHYLFIAKRRSLRSFDPDQVPIEKPKRKEVWD